MTAVDKYLARGLLLASSLFLAACGDDKSDTATSPPPSSVSVVQSSAIKGVIHNGRVQASRWVDGAWSPVATAMTDEAGAFSLNLQGASAGILRLELALSDDPATPTRMRCDAPAGCGSAAFGEWQTQTASPALLSWAQIDAAGDVTVMPITPLSTMVVRYAESLSGVLNESAITFARNRLAALLGVTSESLMTRPGDVTSATFLASASADALRVSLFSAAFSQMSAGGDLNQTIDAFVDAFISNNGRLLQAGNVSLADLLIAATAVAGHVGVDTASLDVDEWQLRLATLADGQLLGLNAAVFDSNVFVTDLGALGDDVKRVMRDSGAVSLEHLFVKELSEFGWLLGAESPVVAEVALQTVIYAAMGSAYLDVLPTSITQLPLAEGELNVTLKRKTATVPNQLLVAGTFKGLLVNVTVDLTTFKQGAAARLFTYKAVGSVGNDRIDATIDGVFSIDPHETELGPLLAAIDSLASQIAAGSNPDLSGLSAVVAAFLTTGHGTFALDGHAGIENLLNGSQLAVTGKASAELDMDGAANGGVLVNGGIAYGDLILPNGDNFRIVRGSDQHLTFTLDSEGNGSMSARFLANILTVPEARVIATGSIARAGLLASHVRDEAVNVLNQFSAGAAVDIEGALAGILAFDFTGMNLVVDGRAVVDSWSKTYRLKVRNGEVGIYQPNSDSKLALSLSLGQQGVFVQTATRSWLIGVDFANPALIVSDSDGGESRYSFDMLLGYVASI